MGSPSYEDTSQLPRNFVRVDGIWLLSSSNRRLHQAAASQSEAAAEGAEAQSSVTLKSSHAVEVQHSSHEAEGHRPELRADQSGQKR